MATAEEHNRQLLLELEVGDLVQFPRGIYSHWAVYIGEGEVAHLAGEEGDGLDSKSGSVHLLCDRTFEKAFVKVDRFLRVAGNSKALKNNSKDKEFRPLPPDEIVGNALMRIGEMGYSVLYQNCEHFASWCRYGCGKSEQADKLLTGLSIITTATAAAGLLLSLARGAKLLDLRKQSKR